MTDKVTVTVEWTPSLLNIGAKKFQKTQQRQISWVSLALLLLIVITVMTVIPRLVEELMMRVEHDRGSFRSGVIAGIIQMIAMLVVVFLGLMFINRKLRRRIYESAPMFDRPWTVQLSVEGMHSHGPYTSGRTEWAAVVDVVEAKTATIVSLGGGGFVPLPNAGLPEGVTQHELLRRIDAWRSAAAF